MPVEERENGINEKDYYSALMNAIENKMIADSDKIIEEKVNSFRNNLKNIRDMVVGEMVMNIRMISETDDMGNVYITIKYN